MRPPVMTPPPPQLSRPTIVAYNRKGSMNAMTGSEAWGPLTIGRDECTAMDGLCCDWVCWGAHGAKCVMAAWSIEQFQGWVQ